MSDVVKEIVHLAPDAPETWPDIPFEQLYAMSWRDYEDAQLGALKLRFEQLGTSVAALEKLAKREGISAINSLEDALPLLFDHRVYKSYPLAIIEKRDIARLNGWLGRLTQHDLSGLDLTGLETIEGWLDRLDEFGMLVGHSTGTTGKLSFVPRSRTELPVWTRAYNEMSRSATGVDPETDHVDTFFPGYRGGHHMMLKMLQLFNVPAAGGPEHYHTLYQTHISADLSSLAGRMQVAEDRGELDKLGLDPALLQARQDLMAQAKRREQDLQDYFDKLFTDFRGKRVRLGGTAADLIRTARSGIERGIRPDFAPGSFIMTGGGLKGMKDPPEDWEQFVKDFFGLETIGMMYGMSEWMGGNGRCSHGDYHMLPHAIPLLFDGDMKLLPRQGSQTGRFAFIDLLAQTYWGGFISGDQVTIHWEEDCPCGWKGPRIGPEIGRFADKEGGDDKISCAGTAKAYDDFMNYISEV
jgi:hypothetical protein